MNMRRKKIVIYIVLALFVLSSCTSADYIDDDTGKIIVGKKKYEYKDGVYFAHASYFNENGYAPVMKMTVKNGIINTVHFDYASSASKLYSHLQEPSLQDEISVFKAERKQLNTSLLQLQNTDSLDMYSNLNIYESYRLFAFALLASCRSGDQNPVLIDMRYEYTQKMSDSEKKYEYILQVAYTGGDIAGGSFTQKDSSGADVGNNNDYASAFEERNNVSYGSVMDLLNHFEKGTNALTKTPSSAYSAEIVNLYNIYNALAAKITSSHKKFTIDVHSLFSSK